MPITLYYNVMSAPARGVLMTARVVGVDVHIKSIDLDLKEHLTPEFLKINPQHTVPALDDNGFIICDSHAIAAYLANMYGKDNTLYPKDPKKRALVDQRLLFNATTLLGRMIVICNQVFTHGAKTIQQEAKTAVNEALSFLDTYLAVTDWVAGEDFTIADCLCVGTACSLPAFGFDLSRHKNIGPWLERCKKRIPDYQEINQKGVEAFRESLLSRLEPGQV